MSIPPPLAAEVPRANVDRVLSEASRLPVTVVTAGPGWGKTTTVAGWARRVREQEGDAVAWFTLRATDDTPAAFWEAVLTALRASGSLPYGHPLSRLSAAGGFNAEILLALLRGLDALPGPVILVLDDFHLITDDAVMTVLADLVSRPTQVHLVLLTRVDPPLPLHRLRLAGVLAEVSAADLAFDTGDVRRLAAAAESLDLTEADLDEVLARTEGWPAGVRLATMFLAREGADPGLQRFGGSDRSVAEYLVAEVLDRNLSEVRQFLLRTSVVELISGDLADAIVPGGGGHARLTELVRANQFIACVNPERTVFRYHPLLRDLLVHSLQHGDPVAFHEANRAAASWLVANGHPVRGLGHAIAAEDWDLAAHAYFEASASMVGVEGTAVVEHLRAIPFASLAPSAALELCAAGLEYGLGHFDAMEQHLVETRRLLVAGDQLPPVALAFMENLAGASARARGEDAAVAIAAAAALEQVSRSVPGSAAEAQRLIATTQSAIALLRAGDVVGARARLTTVVHDSFDGDVGLMLLGARAQLAWCDLVEGGLDEAIARAREVLDDATARGWTTQLQVRPAYLALAVARMLRGELEAADRILLEALAADLIGLEAWPTITLYLAQASVAVARRRPRAAAAAMASARAVMRDRPVSPSLADTVTRVITEVALLTGTEDGHLPTADVEALTATGWSARARAALHRGDLPGALRAAERVLQAPESGLLDDRVATIEATICAALVAQEQMRPADAARITSEALALAAERGILRPFLVCDPGDMARLLRTTTALRDGAAVRDAVLARLGDAGQTAAFPEPEPLLEPLTERELAVLAQLPTMRTNEEIARDFYVSVNTVKSHLTHLYRKLGVGNRREAVRRARELGLLP